MNNEELKNNESSTINEDSLDDFKANIDENLAKRSMKKLINRVYGSTALNPVIYPKVRFVKYDDINPVQNGVIYDIYIPDTYDVDSFISITPTETSNAYTQEDLEFIGHMYDVKVNTKLYISTLPGLRFDIVNDNIEFLLSNLFPVSRLYEPIEIPNYSELINTIQTDTVDKKALNPDDCFTVTYRIMSEELVHGDYKNRVLRDIIEYIKRHMDGKLFSIIVKPITNTTIEVL